MSTPGSVFSPPSFLHRSCSGAMPEDDFFLSSPQQQPSSSSSNNTTISGTSAAHALYPFSPIAMHSFDAMEMDQPKLAATTAPLTALQFIAGPSASASAAAPLSAFNFASQDRFIVDIAASSSQQQYQQPQRLLAPMAMMPHHNPELLEGFMLDGGSAAVATSFLSSASSPSSEGKRKRKEACASSSSSSSSDESDEFALQASKKQRKLHQRAAKHGTSLVDSRSASPSTSTSIIMGHNSPLLELLQQTNQTAMSGVAATAPMVVAAPFASAAVKVSKKERAELRRQKASLKLQRLEASIALLTAQVSHTKAAEAQATQIAQHMAQQALQAAHIANLHLAKQHSEMGMVEAFFVQEQEQEQAPESKQSPQQQQEESSVSLPPLSPLEPLVSSSSFDSSLSFSASSSSSSASGASVSDGLELSECSSPATAAVAVAVAVAAAGARARSEESSPVTSSSLDDAIDAAMLVPQPTSELVEHVRGLHWAEQARHMRTMHHALQSIEAAQDVASKDMSSASMALRFLQEEKEQGHMACGAGSDSARFALLHGMEMDEAQQDIAAQAELQESLKAFTSALLAKSRACVFNQTRRV